MLLAVGVATCTEMTAGPRSNMTGKARFALAPSFTSLADEAAASGEVQFDHVRIIITRPSAPTPALLDTIIPFTPLDTALSLSLAVDATAGEQLAAEIQYRTATTIFYDGHATVTAQVTSGGVPTTPTPVTVDYVGPGATAKTVAVSPASSTVATTSTQQLTATVRDDTGATIDAVPIGWSSGNTTIATISPAGLVQPVGPRGSVTFTATTPTGLFGTATLTFVPPPSGIKTISGGGQSGVAGTALPQPFVVELDAADGGPVAGATVSFASQQGDVSSATAVTDSLGRAQTVMTLGTGAGTDAFTAGVGTFVTSVSETATPGAAASIVVGASPVQGPAGSQTTLSAQLVDQYGNDVTTAKIPVTWSGGTGGALAAAETETNTSGVANNVFVSGLRPGVSYHIEAAAGSAHGSITLSSAPAGAAAAVVFLDPTSLAILPGPLSFTVDAGDDQPNVPIARVVDASGVGVPGAQLTISITLPGGAAGPSTTATTDTLGAFPIGEANIPDATFKATGTYVISFSSPGVATPATINVTVLGTVLTKVSGDKQTGSVGQALSAHPTVQLKDVNGKVLVGHDVFFSPGSGGFVTSPTTQTDASGNAATEWHLGSTLGTQTLTVTADGATPVTFTATAGVGPATHYSMTVSATAPTAGSSVTVTAQLRDQFGNAVPLGNRTVTWSGGAGGTFASPTSTTASNGSASVVFTTGSTAASYQIHVTDGTLSGDLSFSSAGAQVGPATRLSLSSTPPTTATSGTAPPTPILVQALDANGHPVSGIGITAAISGGFSLRGTTSVTTDVATGTASFSALRFVGAGNATLTFSASGLTPTSFALTLSAAPADSLLLVGNTSLTFVAGTTPSVSSIPNLIVVDSTGTPVANAPVIVAVAASGVVLFADTTVTGSDGMLQLIPSTMTSAIQRISAGTYTVSATSGTLIGSPVQVIATVTQPTLSLSPGTLPLTATNAVEFVPSVKLMDSNNQPFHGATVTITATPATSVVLANNTATTDASGLASFPDFRMTGTAGQYQLTFSAAVTGRTVPPLASNLTLHAGAATTLTAATDATIVQQVGGTQLASSLLPTVKIADVSGNPVSGVTPTWTNQAECLNNGLHLGTTPAASDQSGLAVAPPVTLSNSVTGTCILTAKLTAESMSPTDTAAFIYVQRPVGITKVFTGNSKVDPSKWSDKDNWSGHALPAQQDDVLINASVAGKVGGYGPTLDEPMTIARLTFEFGGFMNLGSQTLTVAGNVATADSVGSFIWSDGGGTLLLTGRNDTLSAVLVGPSLIVGNADDCNGTSYTTNSFLLASDVKLECPLKLDSAFVVASGNLTTEYDGKIEMRDGGASILDVFGSAKFGGGSETGLINSGQMEFFGDFTQVGTASSFSASDSAVALFAGSVTQNISFSNPGPADGSSRFGHLWLANAAGGVMGLTSIAADTVEQSGLFTMNEGTILTADFAQFDPGSTTNGPGVLSVGSCMRLGSMTFSISLLGGVSECSFIGLSRLPAHTAPLLNRSMLRPRSLGSTSASPRQRACAILQQLNRPVRSSIQAACRQ